jgi:hypothetical protein
VLDPFTGVGGIQELVNETGGVQMLTELGLVALDRTDVPTKRLRYGANAAARVESEHVVIFEKPTFRDHSVTTHATRPSVHPLWPAQTRSEPAGRF